MNFKNILLGSVITLGSIFGTVGAAEARPSQCWDLAGRSSAPALRCDVTRQQDSHGTWWSIDYDKKMIRLYKDGSAQIWWNGGDNNNGRNWYTWGYDSQGDIQLYGSDGYSIFSFRK